jgi:hypothetical protein
MFIKFIYVTGCKCFIKPEDVISVHENIRVHGIDGTESGSTSIVVAETTHDVKESIDDVMAKLKGSDNNPITYVEFMDINGCRCFIRPKYIDTIGNVGCDKELIGMLNDPTSILVYKTIYYINETFDKVQEKLDYYRT